MAPPGLAADHGHLVEGLAGAFESGVPPAVCLPSPDSDVDIERIDLEAESASAYALGGHDRSTGAHERVEDDVATPRAIPQCVGDERHGLHCRMYGKIVETPGTECAQARIAPNIRTTAAVLTEFKIVQMLGLTVLEHKN